ncbi:F0F1 ATP synthase subunit B [Candidatus Falkowbacteria bacterium]|uniref:ATP synthase subunit b n=1 Tax=Candidatus Falkowbacteria bacterium CG10_big_fil_rev_8_21_14_0_10_37_18 TaxID=1974562 RepID=A0A2H0V928_9BACT|nr:F0F1 ATP synthase subunit B [Candidatus Falkowbacteria bacterium]NCQ12738.1 F0F1 ATP synthase subunit B [Candidatus Falkowbacteria bacterium]OIO05375.1 MAG: ATP synthase F0 subunit B [Candidatus Falkowbacteria bacterium CG1_02_37_21]PIR95606.1 MAG: ATP synthase F0 subunit B [Candidatus Falkowbacteria bacterium CG10_big_fil_rev_8_21_14_0_10_37_18]
MESLVATFHIDAGLFIAQLVNFAVVFSVLYFFAFKPLVKIMVERSAKIDQSLRHADDIEKKLALTDNDREDIITAAKKQAALIAEEAEKRGEARQKEMIVKAKEEIGQVINNEKAKLERDKAETLKDIKKEVADLVILTVEKVLNEKMTDTKDQELIKKLVK